jgi:hypothetical protein
MQALTLFFEPRLIPASFTSQFDLNINASVNGHRDNDVIKPSQVVPKH